MSLNPDSILITKEQNDNVTVQIQDAKTFNLLSESYLTKMKDSVIVRGKDGTTLYEFFYTEVKRVFRKDGTPVDITDNDILFDELNQFFFFINNDGGVIPPGLLTELPIDNFVFVNPLGDDATGLRARFDKPFRTLNAAKNAAGIQEVGSLGFLAQGSGYPTFVWQYDVPTTGGTGTGLTVDYLDFGFFTQILINQKGNGYTNGDTITITGGNNDKQATVFTVQTVDTIYVYGGTYNESNELHKEGVKWHFVGKPILNLSNPHPFRDNGIETDIEINGDAIVNHIGFGNVIEVRNPNTIVHANFHKVTGVGQQVIHLLGGSGVINIETELNVTTVNRNIQLEGNASYTINVDEIINSAPIGGVNYCIGAHNSPTFVYTGYSVINATRIIKTAAHPTGAVAMEYATYQGTLIINVTDRIEMFANDYLTFPPTRQCVLSMGGNLIINGDIYGNENPAIAIQGVTVKSFEHNGNAYSGTVAPCVFNGAESGFWSDNNGTLKLNGKYVSSNIDTIKAGSNAGSKITIKGRVENLSADVGVTSGVRISNNMGTVIFEDSVIIMNPAAGTPECISAAVAKNIKLFHSVGTNANANANITNLIAANNLTVDANYE